MERQPVLVSYGGGTNSTAMLIEMVNRREPVDAILFADTGGERPETYTFVETFSTWLLARDYPGITVVRHLTRDGNFETLEDECLRTKVLPSIAYGSKKCSGKFKIEPQDKWTNHWPPARAAWKERRRVTKLVGYGLDELHRADKADDYAAPRFMQPYLDGATVMDIARREVGTLADFAAAEEQQPTHEPTRHRHGRAIVNLARKIRQAVRFEKLYPLIAWGWGRDECVDSIDRARLPRPGKSACFFCSSTRRVEIIAMPFPLLQRALALEANAADGLTSAKGLGRKFAWKDVIAGAVADEAPSSLPCECTDGDDE